MDEGSLELAARYVPGLDPKVVQSVERDEGSRTVEARKGVLGHKGD